VVGYPPEPWRLRGELHLSLWLVPAGRVPALPAALGPVVRVATVAGRAVVGTAWVDYRAGSVLEYRELLAAVAVRRGLRPAVTITHIWVDSESSKEGGRELWGIPKGLATLTVGAESSAGSGAAGIAAAVIRGGRCALGRWPFRFSLAQELDGAVAVSPVRGSARLHRARIGWTGLSDGPLSWLARQRPVLSLSFRDFRMLFGRTRSGRMPAGGAGAAGGRGGR
jgi:hypothetical protein